MTDAAAVQIPLLKNDFFDRAAGQRACALAESLRTVSAAILYRSSDSPLLLRETYSKDIDYVPEGFDFVVRFEKFLSLLSPVASAIEESARRQELDEIEGELRQYLSTLVLNENRHFAFQGMNDRRKEEVISTIILPHFRDFLAHFENDRHARLEDVRLVHKKADRPKATAETFLRTVIGSPEPEQGGIIITAPSFIVVRPG